jgi:regulator of cell morphogenesis and NO signaling
MQLAQKVAKVHGDNHPEMVKLAGIFEHFKMQLELHMQKEEMILFPAIACMESGTPGPAFGCGGIENPIYVMTQEHEDAGDALSEMSRLTNGYTPPEDACNSFKVLLFSLARLASEMHQHVHKENYILFPRAIALRQPVAGASE